MDTYFSPLLFKLFLVLKLPIDYQCSGRVYSACKYLQTRVCHYKSYEISKGFIETKEGIL